VFAVHPEPDGGVRQAGNRTTGRRASEFLLDPYDEVLILSQPDWETPKRVVVDGEVQSPGSYTLLSKDERLSDVLRRAGGLTASAYPGGIVLVRAQNKVGRIDVDLPAVLAHPHAPGDPLLQDGDSIHLPRYSNVVQVEGAVNAPRAVAFVPGADINYYVRAAGGPARGADPHLAYVTQPDGHVETVIVRRLWPDAIPTPLAGSTVTLPEVAKNQAFDAAGRYIALSQFVSSLVALIAILRH
jgi:protein involved in polysaccharide export with SLBB domain